MYRRALLSLFLACLLIGPGFAGIFGKKPTKPNPNERVPELLTILKTDGDENKRVEAIDELRYYDLAAFPQIVPALIDVLNNDPKPAVRSEAADILGKLRPISPAVGQALEQARDKDAAMRVRMSARSSLLGYYWAGYKSGKPADPQAQVKEPPLIDPKTETAPVIRTQSPQPPPPPTRAPAPSNVEPLTMSKETPPPAIKTQPSGPAVPPPPSQQPSKFTFFGLRSAPPPPPPVAKPMQQSKEPPLAPPLPQENPKAAVPPLLPLPIMTPSAATGPELPLPVNPQPASPAPSQGPELPPQ